MFHEMKKQSLLPIWACLWLPVAYLAFQLCGEVFLPQKILSDMHSENGFLELTQFGIMVFAFLVALIGLFKVYLSGHFMVFVWLLLGALGSLYVAGEEVSWGQHFIGWSSGDFLMQINDQGETNLHNTSSWLDQKPRVVLEVLIMTAGILIPVLKSAERVKLPVVFDDIYPPLSLVPVACIVLGVKLSEKMLEALDVVFYTRDSEVIELYSYYYVLLYLIYVTKKTISGKTLSA